MTRKISIAHRLSFSISTIVILVSIIAVSLNYYQAYRDNQKRLNSMADSYLKNLTRSLEVPLWSFDQENIKHIGKTFAIDNVVVELKIYSESGELYFGYEKQTQDPLIIRAANIYYRDRMVGFIRVALTPEIFQETSRKVLFSSIISILLIIVTLLLGTRFVFNRFLQKPLADLTAISNAYARSETPDFHQFHNYEEFLEVVEAMKEMGKRIQEQISALQLSESKFRKMADYSPYPLYLVDRDLKMNYINRKFQETFGYDPGEIINLSDWWRLAYREHDREGIIAISLKYFEEAVEKGVQVRMPERMVTCKNGERKPIEFFMVNIGDMILVHLIDLTRRKKMQELMVQTEKMVSIGGLAAGMAHEINNPLSAVLQGSQNILRRLSPDMKKNRRVAEKHGIDLEKLQGYLEERDITKNLQGIRESGSRAAQIILNMLKFTRKSESSLAPIHVVNVLESALELAEKEFDFSRKFDFRQIEIVRDYDPNLNIVTCTETEIGQVILNLLKNAAQAMADVSVTPHPRITIRTKLDGDTAQIEVEDNGPGMNAETRKRIFEPFYTTKPVGQGTGLGLSVSYMIVTNNHKGTMEVESEAGKGTRFTIRIPTSLTASS